MPVGDEEDFWAKPVDSQAVRVELRKKGVIDAYQIRVFQAGAPLFPAWFNLNRENPFPERQTSNCLSISLDQIRPGETLIFSIGRCSPGNPNVNFNLGLEETVGGIFEGVTSHLQALLRVKFNDKGYPERFEVLDLGTNPTRAIGAGQQKAHDALAIRKFTYWRNIQWESVTASTLNPNGRYVDRGSRLWFGGATQWELVATPGVEIKAGHRNKPIAFILREILK